MSNTVVLIGNIASQPQRNDYTRADGEVVTKVRFLLAVDRAWKERPDGSTAVDSSITSWVVAHRAPALTSLARLLSTLVEEMCAVISRFTDPLTAYALRVTMAGLLADGLTTPLDRGHTEAVLRRVLAGWPDRG